MGCILCPSTESGHHTHDDHVHHTHEVHHTHHGSFSSSDHVHHTHDTHEVHIHLGHGSSHSSSDHAHGTHHDYHPVNMYGHGEPKDDDFYDRPPNTGFQILVTDSSEEDELMDYEYPIYKYNTEVNKWSTVTYNYKQNVSKVGIITQCSMDRLAQLEAMCNSWNGLISVTIYITNGDSDIKIIQALFDKLIAQNDYNFQFQIQIHLVYKNKENEFYPINYLRNVSLNNCATQYVFLLDIDFVCSQNLYSTIENNLSQLSKNKAMVIPAFELNEKNKFDPDYHPSNKYELLEAYNMGKISAFHCDRFEAGHRATNYSKWIKSGRNYSIKYENRYEPYIVVKNDSNLCRYDERFNGYGMNKIIHIAKLAIKNKFKFIVLNDGFVTASKHEFSKDYKRTYYKNSNARRKWLISLYDKTMHEITSVS